MPDIEVKLDEIDAKIDQILYAPKHKASYEIDEMTKSKPAMGMLETVIKNITGKGVLGAGIAAGGVAGGIMILADVIKNLTKESKILATVQDTVGKALGLLVDLVLLPFLPLIVWALVYLYTAIMWLGKTWNDYIAKLGLGPSIEKVLNPPKESTPLSRTLDFISLINELVKAWNDGMKRLIIGTILFFGELFVNILKFLWELGWEIGTKLADAVWEVLKPWYIKFKVWWDELVKLVSDAWKKVADGLDENLITPIKSALKVLRNGFLEMINWVIDKVNSVLPETWKINKISTVDYSDPKTAYQRRSADMTVTNNFNGFTIDQLPGMVDNALRQAGDRLSSGSGW
jgi:hypothetical protein